MSEKLKNNFIPMGFGEPKFPGDGVHGPRAQKGDETPEEYRADNPQFAAAQEEAWKDKMRQAEAEKTGQPPTFEQQQAQEERDADGIREKLGIEKQGQEKNSELLSEENILKMKNDAGEYTRQNNHDINNDLLMMMIDPEIGRNFDAHGIAKISIYHQLDSLINLLQKGINPDKLFYTAPLALRADDASGSDVAGGTANRTGSFIVLGEMGKLITESGIKHVLVNDAYYGAIDKLSQAFPQVEFIRADQVNEKLAEIAKRRIERS